MLKDVLEYVPVSKAAEILRVSERRVYYMIEEGKLDAEQFGERATLIKRDSLDEELDRRLRSGGRRRKPRNTGSPP